VRSLLTYGVTVTLTVPVQQTGFWTVRPLKVRLRGLQVKLVGCVEAIAQPPRQEMFQKFDALQVSVSSPVAPLQPGFTAPCHTTPPLLTRATVWPLRQVQVPVPPEKVAWSVKGITTPGQQLVITPPEDEDDENGPDPPGWEDSDVGASEEADVETDDTEGDETDADGRLVQGTSVRVVGALQPVTWDDSGTVWGSEQSQSCRGP